MISSIQELRTVTELFYEAQLRIFFSGMSRRGAYWRVALIGGWRLLKGDAYWRAVLMGGRRLSKYLIERSNQLF